MAGIERAGSGGGSCCRGGGASSRGLLYGFRMSRDCDEGELLFERVSGESSQSGERAGRDEEVVR